MWITPGSQALDEWCERHTEKAAAERLTAHGCKTSQQSIHRWRKGHSRPGEDKWPALRLAFGIPLHAWLTDAVRDAIARLSPKRKPARRSAA